MVKKESEDLENSEKPDLTSEELKEEIVRQELVIRANRLKDSLNLREYRYQDLLIKEEIIRVLKGIGQALNNIGKILDKNNNEDDDDDSDDESDDDNNKSDEDKEEENLEEEEMDEEYEDEEEDEEEEDEPKKEKKQKKKKTKLVVRKKKRK